MKNKLLIILLLLFAAQIYVSVNRIFKWEDVLNNGNSYKFKTSPVDPYDAFRGRYVSLGYDTDRVVMKSVTNFHRYQRVYAILKKDKKGFTSIEKLEHEKPKKGDYLKLKVDYVYDWGKEKSVHFDYSFNRYYMKETEAIKAENAYRKENRRNKKQKKSTYVEIMVKDGYGVIKELYIAGLPVNDYLEKYVATNK